MIKKLFVVYLLLCIALLPGCSGKNEQTSPATSEESTSNTNQDEQQVQNEEETKQDEQITSDSDDLAYLTSQYRDPRYKAIINGPNLINFFEAFSNL